MKVFFEIEAGVLNRSSIRTQLNNSKEKLQYWYPGCRVLLTEDKGLFESSFTLRLMTCRILQNLIWRNGLVI